MKKCFKAIAASAMSLICLCSCSSGGTGGTGGSDTVSDSTAENVPAESSEPEATEEPVKYAGTDSGIVDDGQPHKYFTLCFDDGITQDARIIEILKKYNMYCCTFYIDTGLLGVSWDWVATAVGKEGLLHQRWTLEELQTGIYDGFDLEVHTYTHPSLKNLTDDEVTAQVQNDVDNITELTGTIPVGMAWPGGDTEYNQHNIETILSTTGVRYARCTTTTGTFDLPERFMEWKPTTHINNNALSYAKKFVKAECTEDMLFYVWGHGYELDLQNSWKSFEKFIEYMSQQEDIIFVTQAEFYQLFKDKIPS